MKLYHYDSIDELNQALKNFENIGTLISKVKLLTFDDEPHYYILTDETNQYQKKD